MLSIIIDHALSHISTQAARIAREELLREIRAHYSNEMKSLVHYRHSTLGLYVMDSLPSDLLSDFRNSKSDQCTLECEEFDNQIIAFREFAKDRFWRTGKGEVINDDLHANITIAEKGFDVFEITRFGGEPVFVRNCETLKEAKDLVESLT